MKVSRDKMEQKGTEISAGFGYVCFVCPGIGISPTTMNLAQQDPSRVAIFTAALCSFMCLFWAESGKVDYKMVTELGEKG